jgi:peptidoglycan/xylan/chitin deacetylase (PgdA/CDA1 family)
MQTGWEIAGEAAAAAGVTGLWFRSQWCTSQIWGKTLVAGHNGRELALTFDDGPSDRYTQEVLELLAYRRVQATFFFMGKYVRDLPWLVRMAAEAGHTIGNHSMTHRNLAYLTSKAITAEIRDCTALLEDAIGTKVRFFRPPYGGRRPAVLRAAREQGLEVVLWNSMGYDWRAGRSPKQIMKAVERGIRSNRKAGRGSNILLHDGGPSAQGADRGRTVAALTSLLERGTVAGYQFVPISHWWPATDATSA